MTIEKVEEMLQNLSLLANSLRRDGKDDTAVFVDSLRNRLATSDQVGRAAAIEEIAKLAPLAQYAGFTPEQERLLRTIQRTAASLE
jgi:hypothetical protein